MGLKRHSFAAGVKKVPKIDGTYVEIPLDVKVDFGKERVFVYVTFDGERCDGSVARVGTPLHMRKNMCAKITKQPDNIAPVTMWERER